MMVDFQECIRKEFMNSSINTPNNNCRHDFTSGKINFQGKMCDLCGYIYHDWYIEKNPNEFDFHVN